MKKILSLVLAIVMTISLFNGVAVSANEEATKNITKQMADEAMGYAVSGSEYKGVFILDDGSQYDAYASDTSEIMSGYPKYFFFDKSTGYLVLDEDKIQKLCVIAYMIDGKNIGSMKAAREEDVELYGELKALMVADGIWQMVSNFVIGLAGTITGELMTGGLTTSSTVADILDVTAQKLEKELSPAKQRDRIVKEIANIEVRECYMGIEYFQQLNKKLETLEKNNNNYNYEDALKYYAISEEFFLTDLMLNAMTDIVYGEKPSVGSILGGYLKKYLEGLVGGVNLTALKSLDNIDDINAFFGSENWANIYKFVYDLKKSTGFVSNAVKNVSKIRGASEVYDAAMAVKDSFIFSSAYALVQASVAITNEIFNSINGYYLDLNVMHLCTVASGECGADAEWVLYSDGLLHISGTGFVRAGNWKGYEDAIKKCKVDNGITGFDNALFQGCKLLKTIDIPESVQIMGGYTFSGCESLISVEIPEGVSYIGTRNFYGCKSLVYVKLSSTITHISIEAFAHCASLQDINIPDGVTKIGTNAFQNCESLTSIILPNILESINAGAFVNCVSLKTILLPEGVLSVGQEAFSGCKSLIYVEVPDGATIGASAFFGCTSLESIKLPADLNKINDNLFNSCESLTSITIPDTVASIGTNAFAYCESLKSINIPNGVTVIREGTFRHCYSLEKIYIPDSVTTIERLAFYHCRDLNEAYIGNSVEYIGGGAFRYSGLASISIPSSVQTLKDSCFESCLNLKSVIIGKDIWLGPNAFANCPSLTDVYFFGTEAEWLNTHGNDHYFGNDQLCHIAKVHYNFSSKTKPILTYKNNVLTLDKTYIASVKVGVAYIGNQTFNVGVDNWNEFLEKGKKYSDINGNMGYTVYDNFTDEICDFKGNYVAFVKYTDYQGITRSDYYTFEVLEATFENVEHLLKGVAPKSCSATGFAYGIPNDLASLTDGEVVSDYAGINKFFVFSGSPAEFVYEKEGMSIKEVSIVTNNPKHGYFGGGATGIDTIKVEFLIDGVWKIVGYKPNYGYYDTGRKYSFTSEEAINTDGIKITLTKNSEEGSGWKGIALSEFQVFDEIINTEADGKLGIVTTMSEAPAVSILNGDVVTAYDGYLTLVAEASVTDGGTLAYEWYKDEELVSTDYFCTMFEDAAAGVYTVKVTNSLTGSVPATAEASVVVTVDDTKENLALGKSYEWISGMMSGYPDTDNKELTDGILSDWKYYTNSAYTGSNKDVEIILDLGNEEEIYRVATLFMSTGNAGLTLPSSVKYQYSADKETWYDFGTEWTCPDTKPSALMITDANVSEPVKARYIRLSTTGQLLFIGEMMVYGNSEQQFTNPTLSFKNNTLTLNKNSADSVKVGVAYIGDQTFEVGVDDWNEFVTKGKMYTNLNGSNGYVMYDNTFTSKTYGTDGNYVAFIKYTNGEGVTVSEYFTFSAGKTGCTVSGTVKAFGDTSKDVTIELLSGDEVVDTKTVTGNTGTYAFEEVSEGTYTIKISKSKHCVREYEITVTDADMTQDIEVWLYGDVTEDGIINSTDIMQINRKVANLSSVFNQSANADYRFKVANVTAVTGADTIINATDVLQINRKVANLSSVFDRIA